MCTRSIRSVLLFFCALLLFACAAVAQTIQDGTIEGTVRDTTGAAIGNASVNVESASLVGGPQAAHTDAGGGYRVVGLPSGTYLVIADARGFGNVRRADINLAPGRSVTVDIVLPVAGFEQRTTVSAEPVAADTRSTSTSIVIGKTMLENLPLQRDVTALINLAPGVKNFAALGGAVLGNPLQIDDMSANHPNVGTPAVFPNLYWVQEAQMIGAGADARYGGYTGMLMNLVTRSGTDTFTGMAQYQVSRNNWLSNNRGAAPASVRSQFQPLQLLKRWDGFGQLGGPIRRHRLWFFGGWERFRDNTRPATFSTGPRSPDEPSVDTTENNLTAKLTGAASSALRLDGVVERIHSDRKNFNAGPLVRTESLADDDNRQTLGNVTGTWVPDSHTLVETRAGMNKVAEDLGGPLARRSGPPGHVDALTGVESVNATGFSVRHSRQASAAVSLTRFADDFLGREHTFMFGAQVEHSADRTEGGYTGGILYYDLGGAPYLAFEFAGFSKRPHGTTTTLYAQDAWHLGSRLTVTPGVRLAFDSGAVQDIGHVMSERTTSPRIGVAWDVTGAHHVIVRAHYGHYHEGFATGFYDFLDPHASAPTIEAQVVSPGVLVPLGTFESTDVYEIASGFRMPYVREEVASVEYARTGQASVTLQWIRRDWEHIAGITRPDAIWQPFQFIDPGPDGVAGTADDGGPLTAYTLQNPGTARWVLANPPEAYHSYDAVQAIGRARVADVEIQGSWSWARTVANFANGFSSNIGMNTAGPNATFSNPNRAVNSDGRTTWDVPLDVKLLATGVISKWADVRVSGVYTLQSGGLGGRVVVGGRSAGQGLVSVAAEPPHRRGPTTNTLDLRADAPLTLGHGTSVHLLLDAFNVWNQGIATGFTPQSGPNFGLPNGWSAPRSFRAGVRVTF
jgi:hypothetical protein